LTVVADYCANQDFPPVCNWRELVALAPPIICPAHSHYSGCMSACPDSCLKPLSSATCTLPDIEGCECDLGYVLHQGDVLNTDHADVCHSNMDTLIKVLYELVKTALKLALAMDPTSLNVLHSAAVQDLNVYR